MSDKKRYSRNLNAFDYLEILAWGLILVLPFLTSLEYLIVIPVGFALFASIRRFKRNKTDLKNARNYFRIVLPLWRGTLPSVCLFLLTILINEVEFDLGFKLNYKMGFPMYYLLPLVFIALIVLYRFHNFVHGFRWYISGIKLPGRRSMLIPWRHVTEVRREEGKLFLTVLGKGRNYKIHKSDRRAAEAFVRHYERITAPQE